VHRCPRCVFDIHLCGPVFAAMYVKVEKVEI
jgi:hypothetical protein